jgi:tripartite-type tricarboxylate transporter receptor subunit TctC
MNNGAKRLVSAAPVILLTMMSPSAMHAQSYPNQDIHFVCAFPAGSGADVLVRYFAEKVRPLADRPILVENKVGNMWLLKKPPIDAGRDIFVAATINRQPFMVAVPTQSPYRSIAELTEGMKKKGDKASYMQSNVTGKVMGELYSSRPASRLWMFRIVRPTIA